jgi:hypothetical protein
MLVASATPFEKSLCCVYISIYLNLQLNVAPLHNSILKSKQFKEVRRKLKCQMQQPHHFSPPFSGSFSSSPCCAQSACSGTHHGYIALCKRLVIFSCQENRWNNKALGLTLRLINCFRILRGGCSRVLAAAHPLPVVQMGRIEDLHSPAAN